MPTSGRDALDTGMEWIAARLLAPRGTMLYLPSQVLILVLAACYVLARVFVVLLLVALPFMALAELAQRDAMGEYVEDGGTYD